MPDITLATGHRLELRHCHRIPERIDNLNVVSTVTFQRLNVKERNQRRARLSPYQPGQLFVGNRIGVLFGHFSLARTGGSDLTFSEAAQLYGLR